MTRLVFVDMDDTFLSPDKSVSAENMAILDEALGRGVQFVPCTGRNVTGVPRELSEHPSVRYAVCCNGALVCDVRTHEVLLALRRRARPAHHLRPLCRRHRLHRVGPLAAAGPPLPDPGGPRAHQAGSHLL